MLHWIRRIRRIFQAERLHRSRIKERAQYAKPENPGTSSTDDESVSIHLSDGSFSKDVLASHYAALELSPGSTLQEVKNSYRNLMQKYHPDHHHTNQNKTEAANEVTRRLSESYQILRSFLESQATAESVTSSGPESD